MENNTNDPTMFNIIRMIQTKSESRRLSADQLFYGGKISSVSFFTGFNAEVGDLELEEAWKVEDNINKLRYFFSKFKSDKRIIE